MSIDILSPLQRTKENMTCGITNIPLTKDSKIIFLHDITNTEIIEQSCKMLLSRDISFTKEIVALDTKVLIQSKNLVNYKTVKLIWRNFKSLHPKFESDYKYLYWEIDNTEQENLHEVMDIFTDLNMPCYVHRTLRGFHFLSVIPINEDNFISYAKMLRPTNPKYPPITLRVNPNKYIGEEEVFNDHFYYMPKEHYDTRKLGELIRAKDFIKLGEQYQLVWYPIDKQLTKENYTP